MALPKAIQFWKQRGYTQYPRDICKVVNASYGLDAIYAYKTSYDLFKICFIYIYIYIYIKQM